MRPKAETHPYKWPTFALQREGRPDKENEMILTVEDAEDKVALPELPRAECPICVRRWRADGSGIQALPWQKVRHEIDHSGDPERVAIWQRHVAHAVQQGEIHGFPQNLDWERGLTLEELSEEVRG